MQIYQEKPQRFLQLLGKCFAGYPIMFQRGWYLFIMLIALSLIALIFTKINLYAGLVMFGLIMLVNVYIHALILYRGHTGFKAEKEEFYSAVKYANNCYPRLLGGLVILIVIAIAMGFISASIAFLGEMLKLSWIADILAALLNIFIVLLFYFAMPVIVLEQRGIFESFRKSIRLFFSNPWSIAAIFLLTLCLVLSLHLIFNAIFMQFEASDWFVMFHLLLQFITYPLLFSVVLVLLHDANLRRT